MKFKKRKAMPQPTPQAIKDKRQQVGALLSTSGALAYKADVLSPYGVERIRDLTEWQLDDLAQRLRVIAAGKEQATTDVRKARSTVLSLCDKLGIPFNGNWQPRNEFLMKPRIAGKLLYEMDLIDLTLCAKKLRSIVRKRGKKIEEENRLAAGN